VQLTGIARSVEQVDLRWTPALPADGCNVSIWRDGSTIATLCGAISSFVDLSVLPSSRYRYRVVTTLASDGPAISNEVVLTTPALPETVDVGPPSPPTDVEGTGDAVEVRLAWQAASDDTDISAYEVRRNGILIAEVDSATLSYVDLPLEVGSEAIYSVTAFDVLGQGSRPAVITVTGPAASEAVPANGEAAR
jgi:hypothetical protein